MEFRLGGVRNRYIFQDEMLSRYLPGRSRSSYMWYVKFGPILSKNADALPLLKSLIEGQDGEKEMGIWHLGIVVLNAK